MMVDDDGDERKNKATSSELYDTHARVDFPTELAPPSRGDAQIPS